MRPIRTRARRPSRVALIESRQTSRAVLTSSIITTQPSRIACTNAESTSATCPPGAGDGHPVVAEEELVRARAGLHLDEAVERGAAAVLDRAAALGPEPVGDRAGDLALARAGRADQAQEARARGVVHVQQRERERVDALAVQRRRVDPLAVGQHDRLAGRLELERLGGEGVGGEVAFGGDLVELPPGQR